jgi:hypothetical protein
VDEVAHLDALLSSLANVRALGVEVIVLANNRNAEIFEQLRRRHFSVRFELSTENLSADRNWQRCQEFLSSCWFKIVCADDILETDALKAEINWIIEKKNLFGVAMIAGRRKIRLDGRSGFNTPSVRWRPSRVNGRLAFSLQSLLLRNFIGEPLVVWFNSKLFSHSKGFRYPLSPDGVPFLLDFNTYQGMLKLGDLVFSNFTVGQFRVHPGSTSVRLGPEQVAQIRAFNEFRYQKDEIGRMVFWFSLCSAIFQNKVRTFVYRHFTFSS